MPSNTVKNELAETNKQFRINYAKLKTGYNVSRYCGSSLMSLMSGGLIVLGGMSIKESFYDTVESIKSTMQSCLAEASRSFCENNDASLNNINLGNKVGAICVTTLASLWFITHTLKLCVYDQKGLIDEVKHNKISMLDDKTYDQLIAFGAKNNLNITRDLTVGEVERILGEFEKSLNQQPAVRINVPSSNPPLYPNVSSSSPLNYGGMYATAPSAPAEGKTNDQNINDAYHRLV